MTTAEDSAWAPDVLVSVCLMCVSFAVSMLVAFWLLDARGIVQLDVWFHLDTDDLLVPTEFSELVRHPNLGLFVRRPVLLARRVLSELGVGTDVPLQTHYWLMLLVAPGAGALRTLAAYRSLTALTNSTLLAVVLCLLDISAFATVAVGGVPESYPLTAACLAGLYWLLVIDGTKRGPMRWGWWVALGTVAVGITSTNAMPLSWLVGSVLLIRGTSLPRAIYETGVLVATVLLCTVALLVASALLLGEPLGDRIDPSTEKYMRQGGVANTAVEVAWAMGHTFIAPLGRPMPGAHSAFDNPDHDYVLLVPTPSIPAFPGLWRVLLPAAALAFGVAGYLRHGASRVWALPALAVVASNFVLHLMFGHHYFMYAMHWTFSMIWLMAGVAFLPGRTRIVGTAVLVLLLVATAVNSEVVIARLLAQLEAA